MLSQRPRPLNRRPAPVGGVQRRLSGRHAGRARSGVRHAVIKVANRICAGRSATPTRSRRRPGARFAPLGPGQTVTYGIVSALDDHPGWQRAAPRALRAIRPTSAVNQATPAARSTGGPGDRVTRCPLGGRTAPRPAHRPLLRHPITSPGRDAHRHGKARRTVIGSEVPPAVQHVQRGAAAVGRAGRPAATGRSQGGRPWHQIDVRSGGHRLIAWSGSIRRVPRSR